MTRWYKNLYFILFLILLLGAFLRFFALGENSFVADEFLDMNATYGYFQTGEWQAWDFNRGEIAQRENIASDNRAWMYRIQVATLFNFLSPTEAVARSISALWGIITILLLYIVTSLFTRNRIIGLLAAFLFAVSISGIEFNRTLRMYAMFFPIFLLFSWTAFQAFEKPYTGKHSFLARIWKKLSINLFYTIPTVLLGLVSFHLHTLTGNIVLIILTYLLVMAISVWRKEKNLAKKYAYYFVALVLLIVFGILFFGKGLQPFTQELIFFDNHWSYVVKILRDYAHPLLATLLLIAGSAYLLQQKNPPRDTFREGMWITVSFFTILFASIFLWRRNIGPQYIFFAQSFAIILIASGIYAIADFLRRHLRHSSEIGNSEDLLSWLGITQKHIFTIVIILGVLLVPNYGYFFEENTTYHQTSRSDNPNYREVFTYFKKHRKTDDVLVTRNFRNYYFAGEKVSIFDFGGERTKKMISLVELQNIMSTNSSGWIIYADNDEVFISKEARIFIEENLEKINDIAVRGNIRVYRW